MSTITSIAGSDVVANSRAVINTNFSNLNTDKVEGQSSSVDSEIALFSGTGGKTIKRASSTGLLKATSGVIGTVTDSSGLAGLISDETGSGALVFGTSPTITTPTIDTPVVKAWSGWQLYSAVTPTYTSADDPTYVITFAGVDLTSIMSVGMKVKFTNNSTTFYGFISALSFSTNTVMTLYGGTDYDVANSAISAFYFSTDRAPQGFPLDPTKWSVLVTDATQQSGAISATTWTNVGSTNAQITIPIGIWDVYVKASAYADRTTAGTGDGLSGALSTASNTASDGEMMALVNYYGSGVASTSDLYGGILTFRKTLVLAAKTLYYLNWYSGNAGTVTQNVTTYGGTMVLRATIAYL